MRHDLADIFCTTTEGVRGQKAKDWRLVDDIAKPGQFAAKVQERALQLAAQSDRPAGGKGVALTPLQRTIEADALRYQHVTVQIDRSKRAATFTVKAPAGAQPTDIAAIEAAGAAWYPLQLARELEDAILSMRTNELDIGIWLIKTEGDAAAVLAMDATLQAHREHWLVRETIGLLRRSFSRLDVSSRSLFALIEPGSCFAGTLLELALACDRSYQLVLPDEPERAPSITVGDLNFGSYPMVTGQSRLQRRFYDEQPALEAVRAKAGPAARRRRRTGAGPGDQRARRHRLGRRDAHRHRGACGDEPRCADRHGSQPALQRPGEHVHPRLRPPDRLAELDLPAPQCGGREGRTQGLRQGREIGVRLESCLMTHPRSG